MTEALHLAQRVIDLSNGDLTMGDKLFDHRWRWRPGCVAYSTVPGYRRLAIRSDAAIAMAAARLRRISSPRSSTSTSSPYPSARWPLMQPPYARPPVPCRWPSKPATSTPWQRPSSRGGRSSSARRRARGRFQAAHPSPRRGADKGVHDERTGGCRPRDRQGEGAKG